MKPEDAAKKLAVSLRKNLAEAGVKICHNKALNVIASMHGLREWNTLRAALSLAAEAEHTTAGAASKSANQPWAAPQEVSVLLKVLVNVRLQPFKAASPAAALEKAESLVQKDLERIFAHTNPSAEIQHTEFDDSGVELALLDFQNDPEHLRSICLSRQNLSDWQIEGAAPGADPKLTEKEIAGVVTNPHLIQYVIQERTGQDVDDTEEKIIDAFVVPAENEAHTTRIAELFRPTVVENYNSGTEEAEIDEADVEIRIEQTEGHRDERLRWERICGEFKNACGLEPENWPSVTLNGWRFYSSDLERMYGRVIYVTEPLAPGALHPKKHVFYTWQFLGENNAMPKLAALIQQAAGGKAINGFEFKADSDFAAWVPEGAEIGEDDDEKYWSIDEWHEPAETIEVVGAIIGVMFKLLGAETN